MCTLIFFLCVKLIHPSGDVNCLAFGKDGVLASGSADKSIKIWESATGALLRTLKGHSDWVLGLAFNREDVLASASRDKSVRLWGVATGTLLATLNGHTDWVYSVAFNRDNVLVSASHDCTVKLWKLEQWGATKIRTKFTISI